MSFAEAISKRVKTRMEEASGESKDDKEGEVSDKVRPGSHHVSTDHVNEVDQYVGWKTNTRVIRRVVRLYDVSGELSASLPLLAQEDP